MQKMFSVTIAFKDWRVSSSEDSLSTGDQSAAVARVADPRNDALSRSRRCSASALFAKGKYIQAIQELRVCLGPGVYLRRSRLQNSV
jgi:hypothetical protein